MMAELATFRFKKHVRNGLTHFLVPPQTVLKASRWSNQLWVASSPGGAVMSRKLCWRLAALSNDFQNCQKQVDFALEIELNQHDALLIGI